jgi:hypothetical protein
MIRARRDVAFPGDTGERHTSSWRMDPCLISDPATSDEVWIPLVTRAGMAIISRDIHIASRTAEKDQVLKAGARMFAITTREDLSTWGAGRGGRDPVARDRGRCTTPRPVYLQRHPKHGQQDRSVKAIRFRRGRANEWRGRLRPPSPGRMASATIRAIAFQQQY